MSATTFPSLPMLQQIKKWLPLLFAVLFSACGTSEEKETSSDGQKTGHQQEKTAPENTATQPKDATAFYPPEVLAQLNDETRKDPAKVYSILCAQCHGLNGDPVFAGAPNLKELTCPKRAITGTIYSGRNQMPSFANVLTRPEISRLAEYVQGMQQPHE